MAIHNEIGKKGEEIAANFLLQNGYEIQETNWRYKKSEIDIIAKKENDLIFVEVKTRSSSIFQTPEEAVSIKKQKLIFLAANQYIQSKELDFNIRFDIISITFNKELKINHLIDAFYPII